MRSVLVLLVVVAVPAVVGCAGEESGTPPPERTVPAETGPQFVTIGLDALDAAVAVAERRGAPLKIIDLDADAAAIEIDARDAALLGEEIHARHGRCGGFFAADSAFEARQMLPVHADPLGVVLPQQRPELEYPIDRPAEVGVVLPGLAAARIRDTIRELSAMPNRYYQSATGAAASIWLRDRWRSLTPRSDVTVELIDHGYAQKSVVLTIPGETLPREVIVIGGHLDSIALAGRGDAPGADDDASGIATITEVLRELLARDYRPARTIQFMAYAAEEVGLRGSQRIARDYQARGVNVVGALQLDMTNYQGSDRDIWLMKDFTSAAQNAFLIQLIERYTGASWGLDACGYACSDHASWHRIGAPASMPFEARMRDRNKAIHTRRDTLETSGPNAEHAVKFARLAAAYAIELGKGELGKPEGSGAARTQTVVVDLVGIADRAPAIADGDAADPEGPESGSPGHPGAAACLALFVVGLWLARAAADRIG